VKKKKREKRRKKNLTEIKEDRKMDSLNERGFVWGEKKYC